MALWNNRDEWQLWGPSTLISHAVSLHRQGKSYQASKSLRRAEKYSVTPDDLHCIAKTWIEFGDLRNARRCFEALESLFAGHSPFTSELPPADHDLARLSVRLGELEKFQLYADHLQNRAVKLSDWLNVIDILLIAEKPGDAESALKSAEEYINSLYDYLKLADVFAASEKFKIASSLITEAEKLAGKHAEWLQVSESWIEACERTRAERIMDRELENATAIGEFIDCARFWVIHGDPGRAKSSLERMPRSPTWFEPLMQIGRLWEMLGEADQARSCFEKAGFRKREFGELLDLAMAYRELGMRNDAVRILQKAELASDGVRDHLRCAQTWMEIGDGGAAELAVMHGETLAVTSDDWLAARAVRLSMVDWEAAARDLQNAEDVAILYDHWFACARAWASSGSVEGVERCLARVERQTMGSPSRRIEVAKVWGELRGARLAAERIDSALTACNRSSDWIQIAEDFWKAGLMTTAGAFLRTAEDKHQTISDLFWCADVWRSFGDIYAARNCLIRAEETAQKTEELVACSDAWSGHRYPDRARRILERAEDLAESAQERLSVASKWNSIFEEEGRCRRLIDEAMSRAEDCYDWIDCADEFIFLKDTLHATRCLTNAEKLAKDADEWEACMLGWQELDNSDGVARCRRQLDQIGQRE